MCTLGRTCLRICTWASFSIYDSAYTWRLKSKKGPKLQNKLSENKTTKNSYKIRKLTASAASEILGAKLSESEDKGQIQDIHI